MGIAACAFASAEALKLTAWPLIRDTTFYSIALIVLVIFFLDDAIKWWEALILFLWYFCYVIFMKFNVTFESKFLELFPGLKKEGQEGQAKEGGFYAQRTHRKPLLQLMRGKVQGKADETEMKTPGVGLEGLKIQLQNGEEDESKEVNSVGIGCSIGMLFIMLLLVFISIIVFKWEMTKPMGGVMMVLYLVFVIISLGLSECWIICPF